MGLHFFLKKTNILFATKIMFSKFAVLFQESGVDKFGWEGIKFFKIWYFNISRCSSVGQSSWFVISWSGVRIPPSALFFVIMLGRYQSGQMGQTVNLLLNCFEGSNPSLPTSAAEVLTEAGFVRCSFNENRFVLELKPRKKIFFENWYSSLKMI